MKAIDKAITKAGTATRLAQLLTVSAMTVSHWRNRYQGVELRPDLYPNPTDGLPKQEP